MKRVDWYIAGLFVALALSLFVEHDSFSVLGYFLGGIFYFIDQVVQEGIEEKK